MAAACLPSAQVPPRLPAYVATATGAAVTAPALPANAGTPMPTRQPFGVGQLFTYTSQTGDTVLALAAHFNTTQPEILAKNQIGKAHV